MIQSLQEQNDQDDRFTLPGTEALATYAIQCEKIRLGARKLSSPYNLYINGPDAARLEAILLSHRIPTHQDATTNIDGNHPEEFFINSHEYRSALQTPGITQSTAIELDNLLLALNARIGRSVSP